MSTAYCRQSRFQSFNIFKFKFDSRFYEDIRYINVRIFIVGGIRP